ncbi:MAG TPA: hypothetical protein VFB60_15495 [Ktedonobacteraceae bacterium]|nr:hypothetical protein [Ktedonobacteraceae bacterium]
MGAAHRQLLPLPVSAFGASSQSVQPRLRSPGLPGNEATAAQGVRGSRAAVMGDD